MHAHIPLIFGTTESEARWFMCDPRHFKVSERQANARIKGQFGFADGRSDGGGIWGAPHTADIPFAFGTVNQVKAMIGEGPEPEQISRAMMSAFMAFARTNNPNNPVIPSGSVSGQCWVHLHPENIG